MKFLSSRFAVFAFTIVQAFAVVGCGENSNSPSYKANPSFIKLSGSWISTEFCGGAPITGIDYVNGGKFTSLEIEFSGASSYKDIISLESCSVESSGTITSLSDEQFKVTGFSRTGGDCTSNLKAKFAVGTFNYNFTDAGLKIQNDQIIDGQSICFAFTKK